MNQTALPPVSTIHIIIQERCITQSCNSTTIQLINHIKISENPSPWKSNLPKRDITLIYISKVNLLQVQLVNTIFIIDQSNVQPVWSKSGKNLSKVSDRKTYIDEIQFLSKKKNHPPPCNYDVNMKWPTEGRKCENICEKVTFVNTS